MCGIAGLVSPRAGSIASRIEAMLDVQEHRGPDDRGVRLQAGVAIGQVRLAIIDITDRGHQPMLFDDGRLAVVFNGEIFNYLELRGELESLGRRFISTSDTEVLLQAFDEWGPECCTRFNGMWAFVVHDRAGRRLFCSRDRFGVKPFHYAMKDGEFLFSSEIKGLIEAAPALSEPDHGYVARFLRTSVCNDDERTFFSGVRSLLPGHSMWVDVSGEVPLPAAPQRYWGFDLGRVRATYDYSRPVEQFRELLDDAVRLRLRADVPVGTCLSGGLDSSSIVALASARVDTPVRTFSALYPQAEYDESRFVRLVNGAFGTQAHEVRPQPDDLLEVLPRVVWHQDEPSAGPGLYSQWHVMASAAGHVKVLLDGQGADEVLGGYSYFYVDYVRSLMAGLAKNPSVRNARELGRGWAAARSKVGDSLLRQLALSAMPEGAKRAIRPLTRTGPQEVRSEYLAQWSGNEDVWAIRGPLPDRLSNALYEAVFRRSLPALLRYEDRNSMAFSIEARTPFLDYRLVEFALGLPFGERIDGEWTKSVLRRAMDGTLPDEVTWRRDKMGYPTPFAEWLRGPFRDAASGVLSSPEFRSRGIFDTAEVDRLWQTHLADDGDFSWYVWRWLSLELWFRRFVDGTRS